MAAHPNRPAQAFLDVVAQFYDAATEPAAWEGAIRSTRLLFRAGSIHLYRQSKEDAAPDLYFVDRLPAAAEVPYQSHYRSLDPNYRAKLKLPPGIATASNLLFTNREWDNTEYVSDFLRPKLPAVYFQAGVLVQNDSATVSGLGLHRPRDATGFTRKDLALLERLTPHVRRALQVQHNLARLQREHTAFTDVLDRLSSAVMLFNERGKVVFFNRRAEELLSANHGLTLKAGGLHGATWNETKALRQAIDDAIRTSSGQGHTAGAALRLQGAPGRFLTVAVVPLRVESHKVGLGAAPVRAALFASAQPARQPDLVPWLRQWFGLTGAEARVAAELAKARNPEEIGDRLGITRETARTHRRAVYDKMDVHGQAELVKLLLQSPAGMLGAPSGKED